MDQARPRRRSRLRTALRWTAAVAALGWFIHYAYVRITTPTADSQAAFARLAARIRPSLADDATEQLTTALAAIPANPTLSEPPPAGMRWVFPGGRRGGIDLSVMGSGPWTPESRPYLRALVAYFNDPALGAALDQLRALRERPWNYAWQWESDLLAGLGATGVMYNGIRGACEALVARARYHLDGRGDAEAAWEDLKTVLLLAARQPRRLGMDSLISLGCEFNALFELHKMLAEGAMGESMARDVDNTLRHLVDPVDAWWAGIQLQADVMRFLLDACHTDAESGGWLVLSQWSEVGRYMTPAGMGGTHLQDRSRLWNLGSIFFNGRATAEAKLDRLLARIEQAVRRPYREVRGDSKDAETEDPPFCVLDGPQLSLLAMVADMGHTFGRYEYALYLRAARGAARIMLALNRYRAMHGAYPPQLVDLVPGFLEELPIDPFRDGPFAYSVGAGGGYTLYSVGRDGMDDGGKARPPTWAGAAGFDDVYTAPRAAGEPEPTLEPIPDFSSNGTDAAGGASP